MIWAAVESTFLGFGLLTIFYANQVAACGLTALTDMAYDVYIVFFLTWVITSMLVIFLSFIFSLGTIADRRQSAMRRVNESQYMDASITIALFTSICLLCFLPLFVMQTATTITYFLGTYDHLEKNGAYSWYGLLVVHIFLTSLNAAMNPCLYVARMKRYRAWLFGATQQRLTKETRFTLSPHFTRKTTTTV